MVSEERVDIDVLRLVALRIQLVGVPARLREGIAGDLESWRREISSRAELRVVPSSDARFPKYDARLSGQVDANVQDGYVHVVAVNGRGVEMLNRQLKFDCRTVILSAESDVHRTSWSVIRGALESVIAYEERWCSALKPKDLHSALLLPPPSFELAKGVVNHWHACDCYHDTEKLTIANNAMQAVSAAHRKSQAGSPSFWRDARDREFRIDPSRHALAPGERAGRRRFRFCYEVPAGTHFDVTHASRATFQLSDHVGRTHTLRRANADSWGSIRPA